MKNRLHFSKNFELLFAHRSIYMVGTRLVGMFLPIFLYHFFSDNIIVVLFIFLATRLIGSFLVDPILHLAEKISLNKAIIIGVMAVITTRVILFFLDSPLSTSVQSASFLVSILALSSGIFLSFYWPSYHIESIEAITKNNERGRQTAFFSDAIIMLTALLPLLTGWWIDQFSFSSLFAVSAIIIFISTIPLFFLSPIKIHYEYTHGQVYQQLFQSHWRKFATANFLDGIRIATQLYIWPIVIFQLLQGNYTKIGIIATISTIVLIITQSFIGYFTDKHGREKMLKITAWLNATGWVLKIFASTALGVFLVDTYHKVSQSANQTSLNLVRYDDANNDKSQIDEMMAIKEVAKNFGNSFGIALAILVFIILNNSQTITAIFIITALSTLGASYFVHIHKKS